MLRITLLIIPFLISCSGNENTADGIKDLLIEGQYKMAADLILQNEELNFEEIDMLEVARIFSEKTSFHISVPVLRSLIADYPESIPGKLMLANNLRQQEEYNEAMIIYDEIAQIDSIRFIVLPERARLYIHLEEMGKADKDIVEAKKLQPKYFANFLADGLLQYSQGRQQEALDLFEIAEDLDPGVSSEASLFAGFILLRNNVNYDALGKFTRAIDVGKNINVGEAYVNRGVCQINLQDTLAACLDWDSAYVYIPEKAKKYIEDYCGNH